MTIWRRALCFVGIHRWHEVGYRGDGEPLYQCTACRRVECLERGQWVWRPGARRW